MFIPQFCPNPKCRHHQAPNPRTPHRWYRRQGTYSTKLHGPIPRFLCRACGRSFSTQTFRLTYYDKLDVSYERILIHLCHGQGLRQIARTLGLSHKVVFRRQAKLVPQTLSHHARLFHHAQLDPQLVLGGFESFAYSQRFPTSIQLLVGAHSEVVWGFNILTAGPNEQTTQEQKEKHDQLENDEKAFFQKLVARVSELFQSVQQKAEAQQQSLTLISDEHPVYPSALEAAKVHHLWQHHCISSQHARTQRSPLFPANYLDRQLRKDLAEHVRETTRWAKRAERQIGRIAIYLAWHHAQKPYRMNGEEKRVKHLEKVGMSHKAIQKEWDELFTERRFGSREPLTQWHRRVWNREDGNPLLPQAAVPKYLQVA